MAAFLRMMISTLILWILFDKGGINLEVRYICMTILLFGWVVGAEIGKIGDLSWQILKEIRGENGSKNDGKSVEIEDAG